MSIDTDGQFEMRRIAKVEPAGNGWFIQWDGGGWSLYVTNENCKQAPAVDEWAKLYGKGLGYTVRGIVIAGRVYRYQTEQEERDAHVRWVEQRKRERAEKEVATRSDRDARIAALPDPLRKRIERFQRIHESWRAEHEPYELFVCEEAATAFAALKTREAIADFSRLSYKEQEASGIMPRLAEHSGNTMSAALHLATALADGDDSIIPKIHGALCPLVGCKDYGCFAAHQEAP